MRGDTDEYPFTWEGCTSYRRISSVEVLPDISPLYTKFVCKTEFLLTLHLMRCRVFNDRGNAVSGQFIVST